MEDRERMELALVRTSRDPEALAACPDEDLIVLVHEGSERAFEVLVSRFKSPLVNFLYRMVGDSETAEDLTQETLIRVYRNAGRYRRIAKFSTWIYTIAANLAKNELRNRARRPTATWDDVQNLNLKTDEYAPTNLRSTPADARAESNEIQAAIRKGLETLPERFRSPFVLRDVEGFAYEEIATMLRLPKGTVKSRINRARLRFKEYLESSCPDLVDREA